jgi:transcriptional regulator with PAS, ATPase and Fis domain
MNKILTNIYDSKELQKFLIWYSTIDKQVLEKFQDMMLQCSSNDLQELINIYNKNILEEQKQAYLKSVLSYFKYHLVIYDKDQNKLVIKQNNLKCICLDTVMKDFTDPKDCVKFLNKVLEYRI